eukprot:TRINITY_DN11442_c0_g1_i1.p1 TRINITY_DN11442_c0_g1~~TRINITY_DN11442_c0_g1_i1.p1  ORF type:complete len:147 (-),score=9.15 TRINITY_DN11442_c0_g1_i1:142-582(-)
MSKVIFTDQPEGFKADVEVATCFCEYENKILLLLRHENKRLGKKWCLPGGKLDSNETPAGCAIRETCEETSIVINHKHLISVGKVYVVHPDLQFVYHMFKTNLSQMPQIKLSPEEHTNYKWVYPREALALPLVLGEHECMSLAYQL